MGEMPSIVFNPNALRRPLGKALKDALQSVATELNGNGRLRKGLAAKGFTCLLALEGDGCRFILIRIGSDRWNQLSSREREVAILVGTGLSNKSIARRLGISPATVAVYIRRTYSKLAIGSRISLAQYSILEAACSWPAIEP